MPDASILTRLGIAYKNIASGSLYPTVSIGRATLNVDIRANFGREPFMYNLDKHWARNNGLYFDNEINIKNVIDRQLRQTHWSVLSNPARSPHTSSGQNPPFSTEQRQATEASHLSSGTQNFDRPCTYFASVDNGSFQTTLFADGSTDADLDGFVTDVDDRGAGDSNWEPAFLESASATGHDNWRDNSANDRTDEERFDRGPTILAWPSLFDDRDATAGHSNEADIDEDPSSPLPQWMS